MAKKRPQVALVYDFDGTLSPGNMQEFGFIQATGKTKDEFWEKNRKFAEGKDANGILTYMYLMLDEAKKNNISLTRESFQKFGKDVELFRGVKQWFSLVNEYGNSEASSRFSTAISLRANGLPASMPPSAST